MRLKYISSTILLVVLLGSSSISAEKDAWSWGAEETLDPKDPLPIESHSDSPIRTAKDLNLAAATTNPKDDSKLVLEASDSSRASVSVKFEESGILASDDVTVDALTLDDVTVTALTSDDINVSVEEGDDNNRTGRFLGLGNKLCALGIGSNCKKNYQPAVQSHYGAPVKTLSPSGSYGPPHVPHKPTGNYGPPQVPHKPTGNYGPPPVPHKPTGNYGPPQVPHKPTGNYGPPPVYVSSAPVGNYGPPPVKGYAPPVKQGPYPSPGTKAPKGFLGSIGDAVSSFLYKKPDTSTLIAPYDAPKDVYVAPKPTYKPPKSAYSFPKGSHNKAVYTAPKPSFVAVKPTYTAPNPAYNPPKPAYAAPKPTYVAVQPTYTAPKPAYHPPKPAYSAPKPAYHPPKAVYNAPQPAYTAPKAAYVAPAPKPAYTAPKATYAAPAYKPTYTAPKPTYAAPVPNPAYNAPKATYAAPVQKPAYTIPKATYAAPTYKPAYTAPKATYVAPAPKPAYTAPKAIYAAPTPKPAYTAPKATYAAPKVDHAAPKPLFIAPTHTYSITKPIMVTRLPTVTVAHAQSVVHHVHSHTHVYQEVPSVATVHAAASAPTIIATPVIVNIPSVAYAQNSDVLIPSGSEQSIYVQTGTVVSLNEVKPYVEDCQCVPANYCPAGNIINPRKSSKDISHLLDARNSQSEIKSNSTAVNETTSKDENTRSRRDTTEEVTEENKDEELLVTEENNDEELFADRQGRQLKGFTPGMSGCSVGYVCCRRPVYNPSKPKQAFVERKPTVTIHSSTLGTPRPLNVAHQPKSQSSNRITTHKTSELKSHFSVTNDVHKNPKPTISVFTSSNRRRQVPAYNEDCHCIPENHCSASDIVPRNSQKDISHLLDARNKDADILSTATDSERVRRSTDNITLETTGNFTESGNSTDRQGRQLLGVTPGSFGCRQGYVCCRRPVFKPKKINATPFNAIANTAAVVQKPRPLNSITTSSQKHPLPEVEIEQATRVQAVVSPYSEDCHCIPRNFCPVNNIVARNSPNDISHLLDARNKDSNILSTASEERVRRSTNESSGNDTETSARQARQLQGYTPGNGGCGIDYVCCRRPVYTPTRNQKAIIRPTRKPVQVQSHHATVVQVQRVPQQALLSAHTPKPVILVAQQSLLQHQVPAYREQCTCVAPNFCQQNNIVARNSPLDISYLLDARDTGANITSNATENRSRRSTNDETDLVNEETPYSDRQGRQVKSFPPGVGGCHAGTVCCRQPNFRVQNAIPTTIRPPVIAQTVNVIQPRSKYTCGRSNSQSLLGRVKTPHFEQGDTEFGEYPWQAAILKMAEGDAQYVCGAALIDDQHLLTAAHCIDGIQPYNLKVRLGEWDVASESEFFSHIQMQVADVYIHKDYYKGNLQNDIAVMKLTVPVDFASNPHITPVCLPEQSANFRSQQCTVTGWGKDTFGNTGKFQKILKEVSVPVVDHRQCQETLRTTRLGRSYSLDQGMLCAGGEEGRDACKGDGGSPLVCKGSNGAYHLAGLVSWGIGCGDRGIPGVYVNVQHYITWINAIQNS